MRFMGAKASGKAGKRLDFGVFLACPTLSWDVNIMGCPGQVIITPKAGKGTGMVAKAKELAEKHGWLLGATPSVCLCSKPQKLIAAGHEAYCSLVGCHEVPLPAVRERGECRVPLQDHRPGDFERLRGHEAGLLRAGLWHGWHFCWRRQGHQGGGWAKTTCATLRSQG